MKLKVNLKNGDSIEFANCDYDNATILKMMTSKDNVCVIETKEGAKAFIMCNEIQAIVVRQ